MDFRFLIIVLFPWTECSLREYSECSNIQFECDNGQCIPKENWCSNYHSRTYYFKSCDDGSSDRNCDQNYPWCRDNQKWCETGNKKCIPDKWICDGYKDCDDASDEGQCLKNGHRIKDIPGVLHARKKADAWLRTLRNPNGEWGENTDRVIVALRLSNSEIFSPENELSELIIKRLHVQLLENLLRNSTNYFPTHKMASYLHALLAICYDPSNFHGYNVTEELEERFRNSTDVNPFVVLVLCNAGSKIPLERSQELIDMAKQSDTIGWIDTKALVLLALSCMRNSVGSYKINYNENIINIAETLKSLQKTDGSFENIYTTALIMQALNAAGYTSDRDMETLEYFVNEQKENGSFGDIISTYLVLPLLHRKTLLDLGRVNCSLSFSKSDSLIRNHEIENMLDSECMKEKAVKYSIWIEGEKSISFEISMNVPVNLSFFEIMHLAEELEPRYRFSYDEQLSYVYSIFGKANDPEAREYWQLYCITNNGTEMVTESPEKLIPKDGESYVYWYKEISSTLDTTDNTSN